MSTQFPFTAIVGMERAKRSLICHAIDPHLGGLILLGHRGCAKSTLARAFAFALPPVAGAEEVPFVEIPLGTTEDRLLGSIDAAMLLEKGEWSARVGLIQQANQGILYVDEINLLPDHLSDSILDSAASGQHRIERDGISSKVAARYILIGSMNPEEGDLRPQLLDRFSHGVQVSDDFSVEERMTIVERRMAFDDDPVAFVKAYQDSLEALRERIIAGREKLASLQIPEALRMEIAQTAKSLNLEGVRAELATMRTARCLAAWEGRQSVESVDVQEAWILCLGHRQPEALTPPNPSPPQPQAPPPQSSPQASASRPSAMTTPFSPTEARRDHLKLEAPQVLQHEALKTWWQEGSLFSGLQHYSNRSANQVMQREIPYSDICWVHSLIASLQQGWRPGQTDWQLRFRRATRKANTWIFLDASRSTVAIRFLSEARNVLLSLRELTKTNRFQILLLQNNQSSWLFKRGTLQQAEQTLTGLEEAGGKSYLAKSLQQLARSIQRQGVSGKDHILICTDGLTSPEPGETAQKALQRFQYQLQRLTRFEIPIAWLHPAPKRGLLHWIPKLIGNLPIYSLALESRKQ